MDKKHLIIMQILMTLMMAFGMSGIMMLLILGPVPGFVGMWMKQFLIAWPIAFLMTQGVARIAMPLAGKIRARLA